jgi:PAS domain S-box-containing protein
MLEESQESYKYLIQNSPDIIYTLDRAGKFSFIAGPVKELLGYEKEELLGKHYSEIVHSDDLEKAQYTFNERRLVSRKSQFVELRFNINPDTVGSMGGLSQRTVELRSKGVYELEGESSNQVGSYGVARDITERKKSEEMIGNNLKEKEVLLKEIHHRVKNNMQIISSLIKLQERRVEEEEVRRALGASQNRIMAMSLIHEVLYQSGDLAAIDLSLYIKRLASNLFGVFGVNSKAIKLSIEVDQLSLGMNQALPCGLILNELLSNALQYAFTEREGGEIIVEASPLKEGVVTILVADNGKGLPLDAEGEPDKLGLKLVRGLVEDQLNGELEISRDAGTVYTFRFKKR